jgi:hypothetical protein
VPASYFDADGNLLKDADAGSGDGGSDHADAAPANGGGGGGDNKGDVPDEDPKAAALVRWIREIGGEIDGVEVGIGKFGWCE